MNPDSKPGADRVAVCAGMWRPVEMSDGDILKLFQSGKQGEKNYRQFDGEWYVLDESPEAIAEARQEERIKDLEHCFNGARNGENAKYEIICKMIEEMKLKVSEIASLTAEKNQLAVEIDMARRDRDRAESENERLRRELKDLKESYYPPRKKNEN